MSLYPETQALQAHVGEGTLELTYPDGKCSRRFSLLVSPSRLCLGPRNVQGFEDVAGVSVGVARTVYVEPETGYCGFQRTCEPIQ